MQKPKTYDIPDVCATAIVGLVEDVVVVSVVVAGAVYHLKQIKVYPQLNGQVLFYP